MSPDVAVLSPEPARPNLPRRLRALIFESETSVFSRFCRSANARCAKRPTSKKHCKNQYETHFGGPLCRMKIDQTSIEAVLEERSASRLGLVSVPGRSRYMSGAFPGRLKGILGHSWPLLARSWLILGPSWPILGVLLNPLSHSWEDLGHSGAALGVFVG